MTKFSFFGGDPNKAHFGVSLRYRVDEKETEKERRERRKGEGAKLKECNIKLHKIIFQFDVKNATQKAKQKAKAEKEAARLQELTGVVLVVYEGSFL